MPIYDFSCVSCYYVFEKMCGFDEEYPLCPVCGGVTEKIIGAPAAHFKGKGFHCNDYAKKRNK